MHMFNNLEIKGEVNVFETQCMYMSIPKLCLYENFYSMSLFVIDISLGC